MAIDERRVAASLAAALALHLLALLMLGPIRRPTAPAAAWPAPVELRWHDAPRAAVVARAAQASAAQASAAQASTAQAPAAAAAGENLQDSSGAPAAQPAAADALVASARRLARALPQRLTGMPPPAPPLADRPFLDALDRALRQEAAGERRLAGGIVRVVTAWGSVYCLKPPPEFTRGGPLEPLAVPTTCP